MAACAVQGGKPTLALANTPARDPSVQPSTSFSGASICRAFSPSRCLGSGRNIRMPCTVLSLFSSSSVLKKVSLSTSAGSTTFFTVTPVCSARFMAPRS